VTGSYDDLSTLLPPQVSDHFCGGFARPFSESGAARSGTLSVGGTVSLSRDADARDGRPSAAAHAV
jgi:hypothetical protein